MQERRRVFDIHTYAREVINKLDSSADPNVAVLFSRLVQDEEIADVCRYFLASLQLVRITVVVDDDLLTSCLLRVVANS